MRLKKLKETSSGLNIEFVNLDSNRKITLDQAIKQIDKHNPDYKGYEKVTNDHGTTYIRSKPDNSKKNNIEND